MDFKQRIEQNGERPNKERTATSDILDVQEDNFFATSNIGSLPACLDLRLANGKRKALPYSFFTEINFDDDMGIEIFTNSKKITITGRNLARLFDYLVTYRVRYVRANIGNDRKEEGLFVKEILIEQID